MCDLFYPNIEVDQAIESIDTAVTNADELVREAKNAANDLSVKINEAVASVEAIITELANAKAMEPMEMCPTIVEQDIAIEIPAEATSAEIIEIFKTGRNMTFAKDAIYKIYDTIYIYSDTVVDLNGATLQRYGAIDVLDAYIDPDNTIGYEGAQNVVIKNGTIEGMNSLGLRSTNLTTWMHCNNLKFENVTFLDSPGGHCCDIVGCKDVTFLNCKFLGYYDMQKPQSESIQIDYASYQSLPSYPNTSVCYDMTHCKNILIEGCTFGASEDRPAQYCAIGAHSEGDTTNYHDGITVKDCVATGNGVSSGSVQYGSFVRLMKMKNVLISGNTIDNYGRLVWITLPGNLYGADGSTIPASSNTDKVFIVQNVAIIANAILSNKVGWKTYAVYLKDTYAKSKNIVVQDLDVPSTAVYIYGCDNSVVSL